MKPILALALMLLLVCLPAGADTLASKSKAREFVDGVMKDVSAGRLDAALNALKPYASVDEKEFTRIGEELQFQLPAMEQRFGKTLGVEFIRHQEAGESLYALSYLQKFEKHAVRWRFLFYRPRDRWLLNSFATDDNLQVLLSQ